MPKDSTSTIPVVKYINERWEGEKVQMTDRDWQRILSANF